MERASRTSRPASPSRALRSARHQEIRDLIARGEVESQQQLADLLTARGHAVNQATISRDLAALGLVKLIRGKQHLYASLDGIAPASSDDAMLRRVLRDVPFEVRRSGLILLLVSTPGSASILSEAIDRSTLPGPEGTLAGDNTVLVLFADDAALERWRDRLAELRSQVTERAPSPP